MARLPEPGKDENTWGNILNDFLAEAHEADGSLKPSAISGAIGDASLAQKGVVQLAGDLGGTASNPTVPGLESKADATDLSSHTGATTSIHGISDTSQLETTTGAQNKVDDRIADPTGQGDNQLLLSSGGSFVLRKDLTLPATTISAGTAIDGVIRQAHSIQMDWNYDIGANVTDNAVGTALNLEYDVNVLNGTQSALGAWFQPGAGLGPKGIINIQGISRYYRNQNAFAFGPIGFGLLDILSNDPGQNRTLVPSWGFMGARSVVAQGATVRLGINDTLDGPAAFVDTPLIGSVDGGTIDGQTDEFKMHHFYAGGALVGNVDMHERIVYGAGAMIMGGGGGEFPNLPGTAVDPENVNLDLTILFYAYDQTGISAEGAYTHGTFVGPKDAVGLRSEHRIELYTENVTYGDRDQPLIGIRMGSDPNGKSTITLNDPAGISGSANFWQAFNVEPTIVYSEGSFILTAGQMFRAAAELQNDSGNSRSIAAFQILINNVMLRADGATLTATGITTVDDAPSFTTTNSGTLNAANWTAIHSNNGTIGTGATVTTRQGVNFNDSGVTVNGTIGTQIGIDIGALSKAGTNIGIRNASTTVNTPGTAQNITAATQAITANRTVKQITANASYTLSSAPTITNGQDGQTITILNVDTVDTITLQDQGTLAGSNLRLSASTVALAPRCSITLVYSSTVGDWIQIGQTNVL